jgi:hypothetical protein
VVIVVAGNLLDTGSGVSAVAIAGLAAARGAVVEVAGVLPADPDGDRRLLAIARLGIRHAALLRSPAAALDPADLDLALRYLPNARAIVLVDDGNGLVSTAEAAAAWAEAGLVVVVGPGRAVPGPGSDGMVLEAPAADPEGTFAGFVADLAVRIDAGEPPAEAWEATLVALAVDRVGGPTG